MKSVMYVGGVSVLQNTGDRQMEQRCPNIRESRRTKAIYELEDN